MNSISWCLLALVCLCLIGMLIRFTRRKKQMIDAHQQWTDNCSAQIHRHRDQIQGRDAQLSRYDFLKYNLKEVLLSNPEIQI